MLNCPERVSYDHFACKDHWYDLPANLRSKVYHALRRWRKTGKQVDMEYYAEAVRLCYEHYKSERGYGIR